MQEARSIGFRPAQRKSLVVMQVAFFRCARLAFRYGRPLARRDRTVFRNMAKQDAIEIEGVVTEVLPDRNFRVLLDNGHTVLAYAAGKMSKHKIRVLVGDRVSVELSPYDLSRGRITYRHKTTSGPAGS